ncbi:MAG: YifB family Mg chelatase-like AAA ATPase [Candidatus Riflebacteria bacterium]|nr:YifB family Mg chelatase-like AAA ATPase [Candidatus Riflebacteria bacterium]
MFARVLAGAIAGCEPLLIEVEVDIAGGLPAFTLVGLPDAAVNESRERVRAALKNIGLELPPRRITVNLAPADVKKEGAGLDVPLAVALLAASEHVPAARVKRLLFAGEMALDGSLRHSRGILPLALLARERSLEGIVVPASNVPEARVVPGLNVYGFTGLFDLVEALRADAPMTPDACESPVALPPSASFTHVDLSDIKGQLSARRALEIAAAGGHNMIMVGPPGSGKTLLARAFPSILPPLEFEQAIEVTRVYSVKGLLPAGCGLLTIPPFRDPHHTISDVALIGGGRNPAPGEVSLAHHGVLFLDELTEFKKTVLEVLREPLTEGRVSISRAARTTGFPARFMLLAAMNPCPCGYSGDPVKGCSCSSHQVHAYQQKLSGPLLDRIDLQLVVSRLKPDELAGNIESESSETVRERVLSARRRQRARHPRGQVRLNAHLPGRLFRKDAELDIPSTELLLKAVRAFGLSARAYDKIIRVARTIADLEGAETIAISHIAEAVQYRTTDPFNAA